MAWVMIAQAVVAAVSAAASANAQRQGAKAQQAAANYNAQILEQNAATERQQANLREETQRRQARQVLGAQAASLAQAGIGLGGGSAADLMEQSATNAELDALSIRYEGDMRARGLLASAEQERYQGRVAGYNARQASISGGLGVASSVLGAASSYGGGKSTGATGYGYTDNSPGVAWLRRGGR